jgi:hypothetical protein
MKMAKKNVIVGEFTNEIVAKADVNVGLEHRDNGKLWVFEVLNGNRWVPTVTQTFRTRREARDYVTPLRNSGMRVRIAQYERATFDRF